MCDWVSWIEKDGRLYWMRDAEIIATRGEVTNNHGGHAAIREYYKLDGGTEKESPTQLPLAIAQSVNRGEMDGLAKAMGWVGVRYDKRGHVSSKWWRDAEQFIKAIKQIKWMDNHGEIKPEWMVFDTRDAAWDAARAAARAAAWDAAWDAARDAARAAACDAACDAAWWDAARAAAWDAAWDAARDAALYVSCLIADPGLPYSKHASDRLDVWLCGYGLLCDVYGMLYVYRRMA